MMEAETITVNKSGDITGLDDVPSSMRDQIAKVLFTERIERPAILRDLAGEGSALRGSDSQLFKLIEGSPPNPNPFGVTSTEEDTTSSHGFKANRGLELANTFGVVKGISEVGRELLCVSITHASIDPADGILIEEVVTNLC